MLDQEKILNLIKSTGPILPSKVSKTIKTDILLASAHLADLVSQGKVRISKLKVGGSPLYYLLGQEDQLYPFAAGNINPKDQRVLEILKSNRVLREEDLDLLSKVALRSLKDFAVPLRVTVGNKKEIFWKWHLLNDEETNFIIKSILTPPQPIQKQVYPEEVGLPEEIEKDKKVKKINIIEEEIEGKKSENQIQEVKKESESINEVKKAEEVEKAQSENESKQKIKEDLDLKEKLKFKPASRRSPKDKQRKLSEKIDSKKLEQIKQKIKLKTNIGVKEVGVNEEITEVKELTNIKGIKEKSKTVSKKFKSPDGFSPKIKSFFDDLDIDIEQEEIIRKNSEIDLIVKVPGVLGKLTYYCKAKSKKKCDEKDLSSAYMEAQIKKLPLLFLHSNEINKKAQDMLESGAFQNVTVKKID